MPPQQRHYNFLLLMVILAQGTWLEFPSKSGFLIIAFWNISTMPIQFTMPISVMHLEVVCENAIFVVYLNWKDRKRKCRLSQN